MSLIFYDNGTETRSNFLICKTNLENLDKGILHLNLKPYDENVSIVRKFYDPSTWEVSHTINIDSLNLDCVYDEINDKIEFNMQSSFELFIFNICALLGIGSIKTNDNYVCFDEYDFVHILQRISVFYLSLEEFKQLDDYVGRFTFNGSSISFDGIVICFDYIHKSVNDGARISDIKSDCLKRGEELLLWD